MTSKELIKFHKKFCEKMNEITAVKNADYADSESAFSNFTRVELLGIATTEQGFLTRMVDKLCRIANLVKQPAQVQDESITDTLMDLANYSIILAAYLSDKSPKGIGAQVAPTGRLRVAIKPKEVATDVDIDPEWWK